MRGMFVAVFAAAVVVGGFRCKSTVSEEFSIDVQVLVPQGFPSYPNATFALTVDEPADAGALFTGSAPLKGGTTESGLAYTSEIGDFDSDEKSEWQMRFDTNPFGQTGVPLQTTLTGNLGDRTFNIVGDLKDGTTTIAVGVAALDSNNEGIRFGPAKRNVTLQLLCTAAVTGCVAPNPDAGTDGGFMLPDAGAADDGGSDAGAAVTCDPATIVGIDASTNYPPSVVADTTGAVHVAWYQYGAGWSRVMARKRSPEGVWETTFTVISGDAGGAWPILRADGLGNTYAVWDATSTEIQFWFSRRTATGAWATPITAGAPTMYSTGKAFGMGANGHGVIAWDNHGTPTSWNIRAVTYDPNAGWGDASVVADWDGGSTRAPRVIVDALGRATVFWCQQRSDSSQYDPWALRYVPDSGFQPASNPNLDPSLGSVACLEVVPAPAGGARAVWLRDTSLWTRELLPEGNWNSNTHGSTLYSDAGNVSFSTAVASDTDGNIFASLAPTSIPEIAVRRFSVSQLGWVDAWTVAKNEGTANSVSITTVAQGSAWLAWRNSTGAVRLSRFPFDGGWSPPVTVVDTDGGTPSVPTLTPFGDGGILLTWVRSSAFIGDIYAATCR